MLYRHLLVLRLPQLQDARKILNCFPSGNHLKISIKPFCVSRRTRRARPESGTRLRVDVTAAPAPGTAAVMIHAREKQGAETFTDVRLPLPKAGGSCLLRPAPSLSVQLCPAPSLPCARSAGTKGPSEPGKRMAGKCSGSSWCGKEEEGSSCLQTRSGLGRGGHCRHGHLVRARGAATGLNVNSGFIDFVHLYRRVHLFLLYSSNGSMSKSCLVFIHI